MADIVQKIIDGNTIRNGDVTANVDLFGQRQELSTVRPNASLDTLGLTNRLSQERSLTMDSTWVTVPGSGQEISFTTPDGTEKLLFKCRTNTDLTFGFNNGDATGVKRTTLFGGTAWESPTNYDLKQNQAFYFSSATSGAVVEINYWK